MINEKIEQYEQYRAAHEGVKRLKPKTLHVGSTGAKARTGHYVKLTIDGDHSPNWITVAYADPDRGVVGNIPVSLLNELLLCLDAVAGGDIQNPPEGIEVWEE